MLKLVSSRPDVRVPLGSGAFITFKAAGSAGVVAAQAAYALAIKSGAEDADAQVAFTAGMAQWGALSWEGVGDEDGAPLELTSERLDLLLTQNPHAFEAIDRDYVMPALGRDAEKNESAPSLAGDTPAGAQTVN